VPIEWVGLIYPFQRILLVMAHVAGLIVLYKAQYAQTLFRCLGAVGQMALTNYIVQSILLSWVFYGFGIALFGRLSVPQSLAVALAIYAAQAAFSAGWLRRFRFGPIEWLWRSLMYGHLQQVTKDVR